MHIGIFPELDGAAGGIYQYSLTMLCCLSEYQVRTGAEEFTVIPDQ